MDKHYRFGIIKRENTVILFNNSLVSSSRADSDFLKNVDVSIGENGVLSLKGDKFIKDYYCPVDFHFKVFKENWKHKPFSDAIHEGKRHFWSRKKEEYVDSGFVLSTETEPIEYSLSDFVVKILD